MPTPSPSRSTLDGRSTPKPSDRSPSAPLLAKLICILGTPLAVYQFLAATVTLLWLHGGPTLFKLSKAIPVSPYAGAMTPGMNSVISLVSMFTIIIAVLHLGIFYGLWKVKYWAIAWAKVVFGVEFLLSAITFNIIGTLLYAVFLLAVYSSQSSYDEF